MAEDNEDNDFDFSFEELSEEEKAQLEKEQEEEDRRLRTHPLYIQAGEILNIIDVLLDSTDDETVKDMYGGTLKESAMIIVAKLSSGLTSDSYGICMQKASIVRDHAEYLRLSNHLLNSLEAFDPKYVKMFREEMEKFRELFKLWAAEIHAMEDEFGDEWGLFIK